MQEKSFLAPDISCGHCVATVERELGEIDGVLEVEADVKSQRVAVRWQEPAEWEEILALLVEIGYPPAAD